MSDMHKRPRWQNEALTKEVLALRTQLKAARETILSYEDREASVCPEDVSFEQTIKSLRAQLDAVTKERDELKTAAPQWVDRAIADTGDYDTVCSVCGQNVDGYDDGDDIPPPHTAADCYRVGTYSSDDVADMFEHEWQRAEAERDAVTKERDELRATLDMNNRLLVEHLHSLEAGGRNTKLARLNELNTERKDELCALKRQLSELRLTDTEHSTLCRAAGLLDSFDRKSVGDAVIAIVKRLNIDEESETT